MSVTPPVPCSLPSHFLLHSNLPSTVPGPETEKRLTLPSDLTVTRLSVKFPDDWTTQFYCGSDPSFHITIFVSLVNPLFVPTDVDLTIHTCLTFFVLHYTSSKRLPNIHHSLFLSSYLHTFSILCLFVFSLNFPVNIRMTVSRQLQKSSTRI